MIEQKLKNTYIGLPFGGAVHAPNSCCHDIADIIKHKDKDIRKYVGFKQGRAVVDWQTICNIHPREETYSDELYKGIIHYLIDLDVLSYDPNGNFALSAEGSNLNPRLNTFKLYFRREEDAKKWKQAEFDNVMYPTSIIKIEEVK